MKKNPRKLTATEQLALARFRALLKILDDADDCLGILPIDPEQAGALIEAAQHLTYIGVKSLENP